MSLATDNAVRSDVPPIRTATDNLGMAIGVLRDRLERLIARIEPIMVPRGPLSDVAEPDTNGCMLHDELRHYEHQVMKLTSDVSEVLDRLAL